MNDNDVDAMFMLAIRLAADCSLKMEKNMLGRIISTATTSTRNTRWFVDMLLLLLLEPVAGDELDEDPMILLDICLLLFLLLLASLSSVSLCWLNVVGQSLSMLLGRFFASSVVVASTTWSSVGPICRD